MNKRDAKLLEATITTVSHPRDWDVFNSSSTNNFAFDIPGTSNKAVMSSGFMDKIIEDENKKGPIEDTFLQEIVKAFSKNHGLVLSSGCMSAGQRLVFNILAANAKKELKKKTFHSIKAKDISELMYGHATLRGGYHQFFFQILGQLVDLKLTLVYDGSSMKGDFTHIPVLAAAHYRESSGEIFYCFGPVMTELLANDEFVSQLDLRTMPKLKSQYSIALYEICQPYLSNGFTPTYTLDQWRYFLGVQDLPTYNETKRFVEKCLNKPIIELRERRMLNLKIIPYKTNKVITSFKLQVKLVEEDAAEIEAKAIIRKDQTYQRLVALGVPEETAIDALVSDPIHAKEVADKTEEMVRSGGIKKTSAGYAKKLLQDKVPLKSEFERQAEREKAQALEAEQKRKKIEATKLRTKAIQSRTLREEQSGFIKAAIDSQIEGLDGSVILTYARRALVSKHLMPTSKRDQLARLLDGIVDGGEVPGSVIAAIKENFAFRNFVYAQVDPGNSKLNRYLDDKFGRQGSLL